MRKTTATVECPGCGKEVIAPDAAIRAQLLCANCGEMFSPRKPKAAPSESTFRPITPFSEFLAQLRAAGVASLAIGIFSFLLFYTCFFNYVSPAVSAVGLIVGACDICVGRRKGRALLYQLLGIVVCLTALLLALLPMFG